MIHHTGEARITAQFDNKEEKCTFKTLVTHMFFFPCYNPSSPKMFVHQKDHNTAAQRPLFVQTAIGHHCNSHKQAFLTEQMNTSTH